MCPGGSEQLRKLLRSQHCDPCRGGFAFLYRRRVTLQTNAGKILEPRARIAKYVYGYS